MHIRKDPSEIHFRFFALFRRTLLYSLSFQSLCNSSPSQLHLHTLTTSAGLWYLLSRLGKSAAMDSRSRFPILQVRLPRALRGLIPSSTSSNICCSCLATRKFLLRDPSLRDENLSGYLALHYKDTSSRPLLVEVVTGFRCLMKAHWAPSSLLGFTQSSECGEIC